MTRPGTIEQTNSRAAIWLPTIAICYGIFMNGIAASIIGPILPALSERYAVPVDAAGTIFTALSVGYMIAVLIGARLMDRLGRPLTIRIGLALMTIAIGILSVAPALVPALASSLLLGLGRGALLLSATVMAGDLHTGRRGMAMNLLNTVFGVGALAGPTLVSMGERLTGSPSSALQISSLLALTSCVVLVVTRFPAQALNQQRSVAGRRAWLRSPLVWCFALAFFVYTGIDVGFSGWIVTYLQRSYLLSLAEASSLASAFWFGLTGGRLLATIIGNRISAQRLVVAGILGAVAAIAFLFVAGLSLFSLAVVVGLVGFFLGPIYPSLMALATGTFVTSAGGVTALMIISSGLGNMSLPFTQGYLLVNAGPAASMSMNVVLLAILFILQIPITRLQRSRREQA